MGIINWIKGVIGKMFFKADAKRIFDVDILLSDSMDTQIRCWHEIYTGHPGWVKEEDGIKTINFAKTVTSEMARLTCLDLSIKIAGSARATYLQKQIDKMFVSIRDYVEKGCANGTIILKPNGTGVDCFDPRTFLPTETDGNHKIRGGIFFDFYDKADNHYTRMEYHRFIGEEYHISNRCFVSKSKGSLGSAIAIAASPWENLLPEAVIQNLTDPLFAVFKTPMANNIDVDSPLGISIYSEALEELKDLDTSYSRFTNEIKDSRRIVLADDRLFALPSRFGADGEVIHPKVKMPEYVKNVSHEGPDEYYQEIVPQLNTDARISGINHILSILAYKCGFSNGYFTFNGDTGIQTATGVEADQQRTIQSVKDVRDQLRLTMDALLYALDKYADLYEAVPVGTYEVTYGFGDITYNYEEDKQTWWKYVQAGKVPAWMYFMKFENMSEEEAKKVAADAEADNKSEGFNFDGA